MRFHVDDPELALTLAAGALLSLNRLLHDQPERDDAQATDRLVENLLRVYGLPAEPALVLLDADELKRFGELRLQLRVNGQVRQNMIVEGDILYPPVQALQALAKFQHLDAGDIVLTGTPVGTAITTHGVTPKGDLDILAFLSGQAENNPNYLHDGDIIEATVATDDGAIDLGVQRNRVVYK